MMIITVNAAERIIEMCIKNTSIGIKLGVKKTGCSGLAYVMTYLEEAPSNYLVFSEYGASVYVNPIDLPFLNGTIIDFSSSGFKSTLTFSNPNAVSNCGCGESFKV